MSEKLLQNILMELLVVNLNLSDVLTREIFSEKQEWETGYQTKHISCAFLLVIEKPISPVFITGRTRTLLSWS